MTGGKISKLTKGEVQGIRLIADLFAVSDVARHLEEVDTTELFAAKGLMEHVKMKCPKLALAESELQKQIKDVRRVWLEELTKDCSNKEK